MMGILVIVAALLFIRSHEPASKIKQGLQPNLTTNSLKISSPDFAAGSNIPFQYSCKSININPQLNIEGVPAGTKSLALIMHDPDAPSGDWLHWLVWNLSPQTSTIEPGSQLTGAQVGKNDAGTTKYSGPCPPSSIHHYVFELYALDSKLNLNDSASRSQVNEAMSGHVLNHASLTGIFTN